MSSGKQMTAGTATQRRTRETGPGQTGAGRSGTGRGRGPVGQARGFTDTRAFEWLARGGLVGYAVWRLITAAVGSREKDGNGAGKRFAALCSGIAYLALCYTAIEVLTGSSGGRSSPKHDAAGVLGWPGGTVIVGVVGLVLIGVGLFQAYRGLSRQFLDDADTARMSGPAKHGYTALGVFGYLARMVVFVLIGYGLIKAAVDYAPHSAIGLDGALQNLSRTAFGPVVLGIVAAGLLGFGLFSIADARYHKI